MNMYNQTFKAINNKDFVEIKHTQFDQLGLVCYKNSRIQVVLQKWDNGMTTKTVENDCQIIRNLLLELGENVWNTYYLLCSSSEGIDDDQAFFIERNSVSLRKYVVRYENDLNRIPFLDVTQVNQVDNPLSLTEGLIETDSIISSLLSEVQKRDGAKINLNKNTIKDIVDLTLSAERRTI